LVTCLFSTVSPSDGVTLSINGNIFTSFGSSETVTCNAGGGPNNMFTWTLGGNAIVSNNAVLDLPSITGADAGQYQCTVTNDAGFGSTTIVVFGKCTYKQ